MPHPGAFFKDSVSSASVATAASMYCRHRRALTHGGTGRRKPISSHRRSTPRDRDWCGMIETPCLSPEILRSNGVRSFDRGPGRGCRVVALCGCAKDRQGRRVAI
jgi:hypothetical protein